MVFGIGIDDEATHHGYDMPWYGIMKIAHLEDMEYTEYTDLMGKRYLAGTDGTTGNA
jgi:hypothetical protein